MEYRVGDRFVVEIDEVEGIEYTNRKFYHL